jgi:hypothetical protein
MSLGHSGTFYAAMTFAVVDSDPARHEPGHQGAYRCSTRGYNYKLATPRSADLWRMHWHPRARARSRARTFTCHRTWVGTYPPRGSPSSMPSVVGGVRRAAALHRPRGQRPAGRAGGAPSAVPELVWQPRRHLDPALASRWRDIAGMTQRQLADAVGVTREYISMIENGKRRSRNAACCMTSLPLSGSGSPT